MRPPEPQTGLRPFSRWPALAFKGPAPQPTRIAGDAH